MEAPLVNSQFLKPLTYISPPRSPHMRQVLKIRGAKRQRSQSARRERLAEKGEAADIGEVTEGYVRQV